MLLAPLHLQPQKSNGRQGTVSTPMNSSLYGLAAEFDDPEKILEAVHKMKAAGYRQMDAYTPFPVHGMTDALDCHDPKVPWIVFLMGIFGTVNGYMLEYTTSTPVLDHLPRFVRNLPGMNEMSYPMNIGGRPFHSWPNFIPDHTIQSSMLHGLSLYLKTSSCCALRRPILSLTMRRPGSSCRALARILYPR